MKTVWGLRAGAIVTALLLNTAMAWGQGSELLVTHVQAFQHPGTALVDVTYDLETVGNMAVTIRVALSTDNGATYPLTCQSVTGHVGAGVLPGAALHLAWNAGTDFPGFSNANCRLRVTADDGSLPYQVAELAGVWETHGAALEGLGAPWWTWGVDTVASDGSFSGTATDSQGGTYGESGTLALSQGGLLTLIGTSDDFLGVVDADADVFVFSDIWAGGTEAGTVEIGVGVKRAGSYGMPDLVGRWEDFRIASLPGAPWWMRGPIIIAPDGSFSATLTDHGGNTETMAGL
jgi:hypothetical protein